MKLGIKETITGKENTILSPYQAIVPEARTGL